MVFSSPIFLFLFLPIVLLFVYISKPEYRNVVLIFCSLFFYAWGEKLFVFTMLTSITFNFLLGKWIENPGSFFKSKWILIIGILFNLSLLVYYKYFNFFVTEFNGMSNFLGSNLLLQTHSILLPIGISFFTFQNISYITDVYKKIISAERNPLNYTLFISFFPHLVAGPIVRYIDIYEDIFSRTYSNEKIISGIKRFIIGLSKKVLLANPLAWVADKIFGLSETELNTPLAWLAIVCYTLQIYFDFSGYSDMAIGLSRMFGFNFPENFNYPYIAKSVSEFWRRWHMSLSSWFRDYVYIPLGGSHKKPVRVYLNLIIVFLLTGLWHGATWNFILWGFIHGSFIIIERAGLRSWLEKIPKPLAHLYMMIIVFFTLVFFRTDKFTEAIYFCSKLLFTDFHASPYTIAFFLTPEIAITLIIAIIASTPLFKLLSSYQKIEASKPYLRTAIYTILLLLSIMGLAAGTYNPFIYYRF